MNIGILTLPFHHNYGGIMQAIALESVLCQMGHSVVFIDRGKDKATDGIVSRMYNMFCRNVLYVKQFEFVRKYISLTDYITSPKQLVDVAKKFDAVVVGSDQVWRMEFIKKVEKNYFFDFVADGCKRIVYGASFGKNIWECSDRKLNEEISMLVKKINAISVRESDGVDIVKKQWGIDATQVLDPTMLLDKNFYTQFYNSAQKRKAGIFCYFINNDNKVKNALDVFASKNNVDLFYVKEKRYAKIYKFDFSVYPSPEKWVQAFSTADAVITDSFHGVAFSIIHRLPFVVLEHTKGGISRIKSILLRYHLNDRLVTTEQLANLDVDTLYNVDYQFFEKLYPLDKQKSLDFLNKSLN